jgi:hypothetical protein
VQERRVRRHGFLGVDDEWQDLVLDLDQVERLVAIAGAVAATTATACPSMSCRAP